MTKLETRNSKLEVALAAAIAPVARKLRILAYVLLKKPPVEGRFALNSQLRRAVQSIGANIAEGFGRYSYQENIQVCRQARGSAYEVRVYPVSALDANFISNSECEEADGLAQRVIQTLNGYIRSMSKRRAESRKDR
jgi:four helix bundle protein